MLGRVANSGASSVATKMSASAMSRLRPAAITSSNIRRHQFSTLQAIPQHFLLNQQPHIATGLPSCRDEDDDSNKTTDGTNNTLRHSSARINNHWNYNTNYNNLTILRQYHTTLPQERGVAIVLTLGAVAATAKAGQYAVQGYNEWKVAAEEERKRQELEEKKNPKPREEEGATHKAQDEAEKEEDSSGSQSQSTAGGGGGKAKTETKRENFFAKFFNLSVGSKYYEGGFEEQMTRKEAALILGVRESSTAKRIKEAHRKLLILNHPDTGGSTYMAGKINEAKELLLKGKK